MSDATLKELLDEVIPVVEAACEFVNLMIAEHHGPVKDETKIKVKAQLFNAVMAYQESQQ